MSERILVTGKKISSMELVTNISGNEKIPTGQPDDLAITPNQLADYAISRGDLVSQEDLSHVEFSLGTQILAEEDARIAADSLKVDKEGSVSSVAGRVGDVVLAPSDVLVGGFGSQEDVNKYVPKPFLSGYPYGLGERVVLNDGEVVKSLVDGNEGDPNVDMTGWVSTISDSLSGTVQTFTTPEAGVDTVTGVADGDYFNVRSSSDESYADEYQNVGGVPIPTGKSQPSAGYVNNVAEFTPMPFVQGESYAIGRRVSLENGDIVKSVSAGNTNNPNLNITGWFNAELEQRGIKTYLDNFPFYIPYSPLVSDYADQIELALQAGRPIVLTRDAVYPLSRGVVASLTSGVEIHGNNATLRYTGGSHIGDFIRLNSSVPVDHNFYLITVDGNHKATRVVFIESRQTNVSGESNCYLNNSSFIKAKRQDGAGFTGGSALCIRGAFRQVALEYVSIKDCALGYSAGTSGSVGINGIFIAQFSADSYPVNMIMTGGTVEGIYSEDVDYTMDQDGVLFYSPASPNKAGKRPSLCTITGVVFKNCWGRSIKTQCRKSVIQSNTFIRTEGNSTKNGNTEVDIQVGQGEVSNNDFEYSNGHTGRNCIGFGADASARRGSIVIKNNDVYLDDTTVLPAFVQSLPRDGKLGILSTEDNKVFGKVVNFADMYVRGAKNLAVFHRNYVESVEVDSSLDERIFIKLRADAVVEGETSYINIEVENNINDGAEAYLVRDNIAGRVIRSIQSGRNNQGFFNEGVLPDGDAKDFIPFRATAYSSEGSNVSYSSTSLSIEAGATGQVTLPVNATLLGIQVRGLPAAAALVSHGAAGGLLGKLSDTATTYSVGTSEPTTQGTILAMWRDASDNRVLNIKNNYAGSRTVSIHLFTS